MYLTYSCVFLNYAHNHALEMFMPAFSKWNNFCNRQKSVYPASLKLRPHCTLQICYYYYYYYCY